MSKDLLSEAEDYADDEDDEELDLPNWQDAEFALARRIAFSDRFLKLPDKFTVREWAIMQDFAYAVKSSRICEELLDAINGAGAFRHFNNSVRRLGIQEAWDAFRKQALRQIAIAWCKKARNPLDVAALLRRRHAPVNGREQLLAVRRKKRVRVKPETRELSRAQNPIRGLM